MGEQKNRIHLFDLVYIIFVLALPFSWASFLSGSLYRTISIILILLFLVFTKGRIPLREQNRSVRIAFASYILYIVLTMIWATNRSAGPNIVLGMLLILAIAYIFASIDFSLFQSAVIDYCWIVAGALAAIIFLCGGTTSVGQYGSRASLVILGTSTDPNEFAALFVVTIPLLIYYSIKSRRIIFRIVFWVLALVELYAVLLTGSRGALVGVIISVFFILFISGVLSVKGVMLALVCIVLLMWTMTKFLLPNIPEDVINRLSLQSVLNDNGSGRAMIWADGMKQWLDGNPIRWLIGYGVDGIKAHGVRGDTGTMHNQILQQIVCYGLVGLGLYLRLLWCSLREIYLHNKKYLGPFMGIMFVSFTITMGPSCKILWILLMMAFVRGDQRSGG